MFLDKKKIPANISGKNMFVAILQDAANKALNNGTFDRNKKLTSQEIAYVTSISGGNTDAYLMVEQNGYWYNVEIKKENVGEIYKHVLKYTLIYTKSDSIRKIEGSHILV